MKVVILGANAAGMSAAGRLRRNSPQTAVIVAEKSGEVSYGACGLPYYIGGFNEEIDLMRIRKPETFREEGIDLLLFHEAVGVDFPGKKVVLKSGGTFRTESYDELLIATGSTSIKPGIPGAENRGIYTLKTLEDGEKLYRAITDDSCKTVAIIGGGYIGLELAEACVKRGKTIHLFEALPSLLNGFDTEFGEAARAELERHGVNVHTEESILRIEEDGGEKMLFTKNASYSANIVIIAVGVKPNTSFIDDASIETLGNGAIVTDVHMRTSVEHVYAAGDCSAVVHRILKRPVYIPLGTGANKQGRFAADCMLGKDAAYDSALGTAMLRCLSLEIAKTGVTVKEGLQAGIDAKAITVQAPSHARYYPNPVPITVKLCYEANKKTVIGAQIMGNGESAQRINVFTCAIDREMTVKELGKLDMGYAPPFAAVWDVVQIAANAAK